MRRKNKAAAPGVELQDAGKVEFSQEDLANIVNMRYYQKKFYGIDNNTPFESREEVMDYMEVQLKKEEYEKKVDTFIYNQLQKSPKTCQE